MSPNKVNNLIDYARAIASQNVSATNHVSLIFNGRRLVSVGTNQGKSHTNAILKGYYNPIPHSELSAFMRVPYTQRDKLTLINFRFNKRGDLRISRPCRLCLPWTLEVFKEIWFSNSESEMEQLK